METARWFPSCRVCLVETARAFLLSAERGAETARWFLVLAASERGYYRALRAARAKLSEKCG